MNKMAINFVLIKLYTLTHVNAMTCDDFQKAIICDLEKQIRLLSNENDFFVKTCLKCLNCSSISCPIRYRTIDIQKGSETKMGILLNIDVGKVV